MTNPGGIGGAVPAGEDWLVRRVQDLERELREFKAASTLQAATIGQGGIRTLDFDGSSFAAPGTAGNYFGADGAVLNNLYLRPGSLSNDALTAPVYPAMVHTDVATFSLSTTVASKCSITVTVPATYTKALITATTSGSARNKNTTQDFWQIAIRYNGVNTSGYPMLSDGAPGYTIGLALTTAFLQTVTGGSTFTLSVWAGTGLVNWAADSYNAINLDAAILFTK